MFVCVYGYARVCGVCFNGIVFWLMYEIVCVCVRDLRKKKEKERGENEFMTVKEREGERYSFKVCQHVS